MYHKVYIKKKQKLPISETFITYRLFILILYIFEMKLDSLSWKYVQIFCVVVIYW